MVIVSRFGMGVELLQPQVYVIPEGATVFVV